MVDSISSISSAGRETTAVPLPAHMLSAARRAVMEDMAAIGLRGRAESYSAQELKYHGDLLARAVADLSGLLAYFKQSGQ